MEHFREPTTPESRTHRVVLLLLALGAVRCVWDLFVGSRYSVEMAIGLTVVTVAYAVWSYVRQPRAVRPGSN